MGSFAGVACIAPALVTLSRTRGSGCLSVCDTSSDGKLWLAGGRIVAVDLHGEGFATGRHLGPWRQRVLDAVVVWMRSSSVRISFSTAVTRKGSLLDAPEAGETAMKAVRRLIGELSLVEVSRLTGNGPVTIRRSGTFLLKHSALFPEEIAVLRVLQQEGGASVDACRSAAGQGRRAFSALLTLKWAGAVSPRTGPYALLLRKHRQLLRGDAPASVLELPTGASERQASHAFRRFVASIHPDRLGTDTPAGVRDISARVVGGLWRAQQAYRQL